MESIHFNSKFESQTEEIIEFYFLFLPMLFGIVFNITSIFIFTNKKFNKTKMGFYYISLSISHTITLIYYWFLLDSKHFLGYQLLNLNNTLCKLIIMLRFLKQTSPWFQVILTFHRFIICKYPKNSEFMNKKKFLVVLLLVTSFFTAFFSIGNLFFSLQIETISNNQTLNDSMQTPICTANSLVSLITEIESFLFRILIPFILIFIMTIVLHKNIYKKILNYSKIRQIKRENHFTYTVIISNMFFMVTFAPNLLICILKYSNIVNESNKYANIIDHIGFICLEFSNLYYSTFFLWNLFFNSLFRRQVFGIVSNLINKAKIAHLNQFRRHHQQYFN